MLNERKAYKRVFVVYNMVLSPTKEKEGSWQTAFGNYQYNCLRTRALLNVFVLAMKMTTLIKFKFVYELRNL